MKIAKGLTILVLSAVVAGCGSTADKTVDRGVDSKHLSELRAGIWIDPNGCDHWIIDDGVEGYLSQRLDRSGKPVCSGTARTETAIGPFKAGSDFADSI